MTLDVVPRGLSGAIGKLSVTYAIDHTHQSTLSPLLNHEAVTIHGHQRAGTGSNAKDERAVERSGDVQSEPSPTHNAGAGTRTGSHIHFVHQAVDRAQAAAQTPRRRKIVGDGLLHIGDAGPLVLGIDLNSGPPSFLGSLQPQDAVFRVLDQIGGQLAYNQRDFLHGPLIEAD